MSEQRRIGCRIQDQAKNIVEINRNTTQTRNSRVKTRMVTVIVVLIIVTTVAVFRNGVIVRSLNGIRQDWLWKKHNLVDRLRTETMAGMSGLDKAKTNQISRELEFSGTEPN